ncbi:MAG TPA: magnesium transporter [Actinotalea sp.]|nr:magnesium transporter [Actinotalea sp.]
MDAVVAPAPPPLLPGSVDQYVTLNVPTCQASDRAAGLRNLLTRGPFDSVSDVAVLAPGPVGRQRLLGLIPVERLLAADADRTAESLMDADHPVVAPGLDQEKAAWRAVRAGESSLAVVDADGMFRGLVPPTRFLAVLLTEHDEDLARLGGYLSSTASARHASEEALHARLWHRLPWLLIGLAGAAFAAWVMRGYEEELAADLRLAFFVPGVVYMADAVGTQTEALVIRGLSVGVPIRRIFRLEALTGLMVGLLLGGVSLVGVMIAFDAVDLAATVGLSLLATCTVATVVAMVLPWAMDRAGRDPAFGSGPLATVIQDLLSLMIYFAIAVTLLG